MNDDERDENDDVHESNDDASISPSYSSDAQMIERARRRYGSIGAVVASGMLGIDKILGRRPKEETPAVWEASGEPGDIDDDGIRIDLDDERAVESHPQARVGRRIRKRRSR